MGPYLFKKLQFLGGDFLIKINFLHKNYEYNLRILANFCVKSQKSTDFAYTFSKNYIFFFFFFWIF